MIRDEQGSMSAFLAMLFLVFTVDQRMCGRNLYVYSEGKAMVFICLGFLIQKEIIRKSLRICIIFMRWIQDITRRSKQIFQTA